MAVLGSLSQHFMNDGRNFIGQVGPKLGQVGRIITCVTEQLLQHSPFGERRPPRQHKEKSAPQRVNVTATVGTARVAGLLRRNIIERAERNTAGCQVVLRSLHLVQPGQAHVHQLGPPAGCNQHIGGLDVTMDNLPLNGVLQCPGQLKRVTNRNIQRQRPLGKYKVPQINSIDELKDDVIPTVMFANVVHASDILVVQSSCALRFISKSLQRIVVGTLWTRQNLDGHRAAEHRVACAKNRTHTTTADEFLKLENAQLPTFERLTEVMGIRDSRQRFVVHGRPPRNNGFLLVRNHGTPGLPPLRRLVRGGSLRNRILLVS